MISPRQQLVDLIRFIHARGWSPATGGNFSCLLEREPLRVLMTPSGVDKGSVQPDELLEVNDQGVVLFGAGGPSAETLLHFPIYRQFQATVVVHTHSIWNTLASLRPEPFFEIAGLEMVKALTSNTSHEHTERVPILDNSQDMPALAAELERICSENPHAHGVLLRGHGLYTWGQSFEEARRHLEALEFLFEVVLRSSISNSVILNAANAK